MVRRTFRKRAARKHPRSDEILSTIQRWSMEGGAKPTWPKPDTAGSLLRGGEIAEGAPPPRKQDRDETDH